MIIRKNLSTRNLKILQIFEHMKVSRSKIYPIKVFLHRLTTQFFFQIQISLQPFANIFIVISLRIDKSYTIYLKLRRFPNSQITAT